MQLGATDLEVADGLCSVTRTLTHEELLDDKGRKGLDALLCHLQQANVWGVEHTFGVWGLGYWGFRISLHVTIDALLNRL